MAALSDLLRKSREFTRRSVTVRIGGENVTLYAKPLTGQEIDKILVRHPEFASKPTNAAVVDIIIMKAETESGDPAFDIGDKAPLLMQDISILNQIHSGLFPNEDTSLSDDAIEAETGN